MYRVINLLDFIFSFLCTLFCLLLVLLSMYSVYDSIHIYMDAADTSILRFRPDPSISTGQMYENLNDAAGWLTLDGAGVDLPVMQGTDNMEYLNRNPYGEFSLSGSLFLDCRNSPDFSDDYSLIYGHHMENNMMFGALDQYLDEAFFSTHRTGTLAAGSRFYDLEIFAVTECPCTVPEVFDPHYENSTYEYIRTHHLFFRKPECSGRILGMSTCKVPDSGERTIVFAMISEQKEERG